MSALAAWEPLFDAVEPVVKGPPPTPPDSAPLGIAAIVVALTFGLLAYRLLRSRLRGRAGRLARIGAFGVAIGNALVDLASMLQPDRPAVVEIERNRNPARDDDDDGDPPDPGPTRHRRKR